MSWSAHQCMCRCSWYSLMLGTDRPTALQFSPYAYEVDEDPYPIYARLREEAPVYHNPDVGFVHSVNVRGFAKLPVCM